MGKSSSTPSYANGSVNIDGVNKAYSGMMGNTAYSNYNMSNTEKEIYNYAQDSFLSNLPNINVFSENTQQQMLDQLGAYTNQGLDIVNNLYSPMIKNLKNDIASRFGNFDNSVFMDNLNGIESNRAKSMSSLTQDILAKQDDLYNNELARRYDYLDFLMGTQNNIDSKMLNYLGLANQNSSSGNSYNSNNPRISTSSLYSNLMNSILSGNSNSLALANSLYSLLG